MRRLVLVRHATTPAVRAAAFGADEGLDARGLDAAAALRGSLPRHAEAYVSPARRARQTAAAAGLEDLQVEPRLAECDFGRWAGRTLADVHEAEPEAVGRWLEDPESAPHGGESLAALLARVGAWLGEQAGREGTAVAVTHGGVVKAAVVAALDAGPAAFWRVDVRPAGRTELAAHDGRWTVRSLNLEAAA